MWSHQIPVMTHTAIKRSSFWTCSITCLGFSTQTFPNRSLYVASLCTLWAICGCRYTWQKCQIDTYRQSSSRCCDVCLLLPSLGLACQQSNILNVLTTYYQTYSETALAYILRIHLFIPHFTIKIFTIEYIFLVWFEGTTFKCN